MKTFLFCVGIVILDAIVPRSCQNKQQQGNYTRPRPYIETEAPQQSQSDASSDTTQTTVRE